MIGRGADTPVRLSFPGARTLLSAFPCRSALCWPAIPNAKLRFAPDRKATLQCLESRLQAVWAILFRLKAGLRTRSCFLGECPSFLFGSTDTPVRSSFHGARTLLSVFLFMKHGHSCPQFVRLPLHSTGRAGVPALRCGSCQSASSASPIDPRRILRIHCFTPWHHATKPQLGFVPVIRPIVTSKTKALFAAKVSPKRASASELREVLGLKRESSYRIHKLLNPENARKSTN